MASRIISFTYKQWGSTEELSFERIITGDVGAVSVKHRTKQRKQPTKDHVRRLSKRKGGSSNTIGPFTKIKYFTVEAATTIVFVVLVVVWLVKEIRSLF